MEKLVGGGATRIRHPSSERFMAAFQSPPPSTASTPPLELSEHDIFSTPSGGSSPSPTHPFLSNPNPNSHSSNNNNHHRGNHYGGILAALNETSRTRAGSDTRPVFNHKASSTSASLSSSSSTSPRMMMIPKRALPPQPVERARGFRPQSAPVNIPVAMRRRAGDLEDVVSEEEEDDRSGGEILPPHEVVASRNSPMLACSVLEGAGRTLKGRDLRQVRNAIWRRTGFMD